MIKKILIIEDDIYSARRLKKLITDINDTINIHGPLKSINEVVGELNANNDYDLIFSDIRLVDGDVFDAFHMIMPNCFIIFTTAYDEYAMQAIKNNGLDYLMKPIDFKELCHAMNKLNTINVTKQEKSSIHLDGLSEEACLYRERFLVCKGDELIMLYADDINYIRKYDCHAMAFIENGASYTLPLTMSELEQMLDPNKFFRINRQYIANIKGIKSIRLFFSSKLVVSLKGCKDDNIIISKEKTTQLKKWLDR